MDGSIIALIGVVFGGLLTGGMQLLRDHLTHKRFEKEQYTRIFAEKRMDRCQSYQQMITELRSMYFPVIHGIEPLKEHDGQGVSVQKHMKKIENFTSKSAFYLGLEVKRKHVKYFGQLMSVIYAANNPDAAKNTVEIIRAWDIAMSGFVEQIDIALHKDLEGAYPKQDPVLKTMCEMEEALKYANEIGSEEDTESS